jgi:outer membrane receptor protein involved in Fe transport
MKIFNKYKLFLILVVAQISLFAQSGILRGTVKDESTGETLIGATVFIVGTYKGSATDIDGKYLITGIKPGDYNIKVSYIGYTDKIYTGISIKDNDTKVLNVTLLARVQNMDAVTIVGEKTLVNLENARSEVRITSEEIKSMNTRNIQEVMSMQNGVSSSPDGLQIRGARVYETEYLVDGISASDPLGGSGLGVGISSSSIEELNITTGGAGAEFGGGAAGVINTKIREGGEKFEVAGSWQRDNLGFGINKGTSFNTDIVELAFSGPVPFTNKKLTFFNNVQVNLSDNYFRYYANQLRSSLMEGNEELWAPRQSNDYSHTFKLAYQIRKGTKITLTNQHSLTINQNDRTLQIVGFDAVLQPGFQWERKLNLDNANTYTVNSNLMALNLNHVINDLWTMTGSVGLLTVNNRADANGRPFRTATVDQIYDEASIVTNPVGVFNPGDSIIFVLPGPGFVNNGGIAGRWHDHYVNELTVKLKFNYYPKNKYHQISFGTEYKRSAYQWADVTRPWVGAPIKINDTLSTPSISVGSSSEIWSVVPISGGIYFQDRIVYKGIIANLGMRLNHWAPGKYADDAVNDQTSLVLPRIRTDYLQQTIGLAGMRLKTRLLPRINVSFPVTENNVLYFNYSHAMILPHPRFLYAGLNPIYQDRSFLSFLGNPNLNPEVNVSYEVGYKSQVTKNFSFTVGAYNNNRFDYIVSRAVITNDATGRPVTKRMYINQDYAKILGIEVGFFNRLGKYFRSFFNVSYQVARGKSNTARESSLQIAQTGEVPLSSEQFLAWDRPWDIKGGLTFIPDSSMKLFGVSLKNFTFFISSTFKSGFRYTPVEQDGFNPLGRPLYRERFDQYLAKIAKPWFWTDLKISYLIPFSKKNQGLSFTFEVRNVFNNKNAQIINPVTGRAYETGDDVPNEWRDPRFVGPEERGVPPDNPARYLPPTQILYGVSFRF